MQCQFGDRLRRVKVTRAGEDIYDVKVEFNNKMRLTTGSTKRYMEGDMRDAYKHIYTSGAKISSADIEAYGSGIDQYGNNVSSLAYETTLIGEVASKINWSNHLQASWDSLWDVIFLHEQYVIGDRPMIIKNTPLYFSDAVWNIPSLLSASRNQINVMLGELEEVRFDERPGEFSANYSIWSKSQTKLW